MSKYRHRRTAAPATPFTNPLEPGEIAVNTANRQIAVGDAASATAGVPKALIAIRYFDTAAQYVLNDFVVNGTALYRANKPTGAGAFVAADWQMMVGAIDPQYVAKAGDTMSGMLQLPATIPTLGVHATNKTYVDTLVATKSSVIVSAAAPTPTPIPGTLWYNTNDGQMYVRYDDGNSVAWVIAAPQPDSSNYVSLIGSSAVRYDTPQTLTSDTPPATMGQRSQARANVYAAPFDAMAYSGMQINGSMEVSQETGVVGTSTNDAFICDGWRLGKVGTMVINGNQSNALGFCPGLPNLLVLAPTTAQTTIGAGDLTYTRTRIEGYRTARLAWGSANAQPITIGFWTAHHRTGVYSGAVRNNAQNRSYAFNYTQNAADVFQYNVVTVPGDTAGTWEVTNLAGLDISFTMAAGTTYSTPANAWSAGNFVAATGQINGIAATSDQFRITGVVVLPGLEAPSAARSALIMRPYDQELLTCQRYWQKSYPMANAPGAVNIGTGLLMLLTPTSIIGNGPYGWVSYPRMRAAPTVNIYSYSGTLSRVSDGSGNDLTANSGIPTHQSDLGFGAMNGSGANVTPSGSFIQFHWTADARL